MLIKKTLAFKYFLTAIFMVSLSVYPDTSEYRILDQILIKEMNWGKSAKLLDILSFLSKTVEDQDKSDWRAVFVIHYNNDLFLVTSKSVYPEVDVDLRAPALDSVFVLEEMSLRNALDSVGKRFNLIWYTDPNGFVVFKEAANELDKSTQDASFSP